MPRKHLSEIRGKRSLTRRPGTRQPRSITLIVCEGETEEAYFKAAKTHYQLTSSEVVVAENTRGSAPISVVDCAVARAREEGGYDYIFCVFDRDGHESFHRARARVKDLASGRKPLPIRAIVSVPCFEVWVLLHFEKTDAPFSNCGEIVHRIRANHLPGYEKADDKIAAGLMRIVDDALARAQWLGGRAEEIGENPQTSVHLLIDHMANVSKI